jgi:hypothetical protein
MTRTRSRRPLAAALTLGAALLGVLARADEVNDAGKTPHQAARDDIQTLADHLGRPDFAVRAGNAARSLEIEHVMGVFRPRCRDGLGVGPLPGAGRSDGIERALMDFAAGRRGMPNQGVLVVHNAELVRMTEVLRAVAAVLEHYPPPKGQGKDPATWKQAAADLKVESEKLSVAIKTVDPERVRAAAAAVCQACNACHEKFRD